MSEAYLRYEYLKRKYPMMKHDPNPNCPKCKGEGEVDLPINLQEIIVNSDVKTRPCTCIYFPCEEKK